MIEAYLEGLSNVPGGQALRSTVVLGPEMPSQRRAALLQRFGHLPDVTFLKFEPDLALLYSESDVVVSMAGYNTVCELLVSGRRAVLVPRSEPVQEQLLRARLFAARGEDEFGAAMGGHAGRRQTNAAGCPGNHNHLL